MLASRIGINATILFTWVDLPVYSCQQNDAHLSDCHRQRQQQQPGRDSDVEWRQSNGARWLVESDSAYSPPHNCRHCHVRQLYCHSYQWRRQDFVTGGGVRYGSIGGLEYEVPQSWLYSLCINVALCSTALRCICRVIRRSSMTMKGLKAHTYYIISGRPPIGGSFSSFPVGGATDSHY